MRERRKRERDKREKGREKKIRENGEKGERRRERVREEDTKELERIFACQTLELRLIDFNNCKNEIQGEIDREGNIERKLTKERERR